MIITRIYETFGLAKELRTQINSTGVFKVLELSELLPHEIKQDNIQLDPTKVTVDIRAVDLLLRS